jgi:hypothetical protein
MSGVFVALALCLATTSLVHAQSCPRAETPARIILDTGFVDARLDRTKSKETLANILKSTENVMFVGQAVGLTSTRPTYGFETQVSVRRLGPNRLCVYLADLTIRFKYSEVIVYVARGYGPESCPYRVTLAHEQRHVALYKSGYEAFLPKLNGQAMAVAAEVNPMEVRSMEEARRAHLERVQGRLEPVFAAFLADQRRRNLTLDTPDSYRQERAKCADW